MTPYQRYLSSAHWLALRAAKFKSSGRVCNRCGSSGPLEVHHLYYGKSWWACQIADLEILCCDCHEREHKVKLRTAMAQSRAKARNVNALRRVNPGHVCARY